MSTELQDQLRRIMGLIATDSNVSPDLKRIIQTQELDDIEYERKMEAQIDDYWERRAAAEGYDHE